MATITLPSSMLRQVLLSMTTSSSLFPGTITSGATLAVSWISLVSASGDLGSSFDKTDVMVAYIAKVDGQA
jgi:hypothetical protein